MRLLTREIDRSGGVWTDAVWEWGEDCFDRWVARRALDGADAVYGYEHACLQTFREARRRNMVCFYEVPAPEAGYAQRIRNREIAAYPELDSNYERRLRSHAGQAAGTPAAGMGIGRPHHRVVGVHEIDVPRERVRCFPGQGDPAGRPAGLRRSR